MPGNIERILDQLAEQARASELASRERGEVVANLRNLGRNFDRHCEDDERRHKENLGAFRDVSASFKEVNATLGGLSSAIAGLVNRLDKTDANLDATDDKVDDIAPVVEGYKLTRARLLGAGAVVMLFFSATGWIVAEVGKLAFSLIVKKLGGG